MVKCTWRKYWLAVDGRSLVITYGVKSGQNSEMSQRAQPPHRPVRQPPNILLDYCSLKRNLKVILTITTMKLLRETEMVKIDRKLLKPQVERRRRERMNRSLGSLRALLLQEPQQQVKTQRRVEKAEILEHTVHFLQNTDDVDRKKAGVGEQHPFQDGFSACLQRAAGFLGPKGEALLSSPLSACVVSQSAVATNPPVQLSNALCMRQMLLQDPRDRQQGCGLYKTCHVPLQHRDTNAPQHPQRQAIKQALSQNLSTSQALWRPWP